MVRLFGGFKNPFDLALAFAVAPGAEQVADRVELQNLLKLHGISPLQHSVERNIKDRMGRPAARLSS